MPKMMTYSRSRNEFLSLTFSCFVIHENKLNDIGAHLERFDVVAVLCRCALVDLPIHHLNHSRRYINTPNALHNKDQGPVGDYCRAREFLVSHEQKSYFW